MSENESKKKKKTLHSGKSTDICSYLVPAINNSQILLVTDQWNKYKFQGGDWNQSKKPGTIRSTLSATLS